MPVIRRGDGLGIGVVGREQLAQVRIRLDVATVDGRLHLLEQRGVDVADRDDTNALDLRETAKVIPAPTVEADDRDANIAVGTEDLAPGARREHGAGGGESG